jgi:hypothetical protein
MGKKNRLKQERRNAAPRLPPKAKTGPYVSSGLNDLFDNPMTRAAMSALSVEEKEKYARIGEHLYGRINFEDGQALNNMPPPMVEAVACIELQLESGLHPSMLEENEKNLLNDAYGEEWYLKWNYVKEDLDDIITLVRNKENHTG